jgi:death-on-curing protein
VASAEPPDPSDFPSPADLILAHALALQITERTARFHVLHRAALESLAARARQHAHYRGADDIAQAAVLAEGLCRSHCFIDGNKRTAWTAMRTFLRVRLGRTLRFDPLEAAEWMIHLTLGDRNALDLERWLRARMR